MNSEAHLVEKAMRLAARYHAGQMRKGSLLPYITHPASVAIILASHGINDEDILATALLHDVLEDTDCDIEVLSEQFPERVVEWVCDLSEVKIDQAGNKRPWIDRKTDHLEVIRNADIQTRAVALADKIHNAESILLDLEQGQNSWQEFNAEPAQVVWYYREMHSAAFQNDGRLTTLAGRLAKMIESLASNVPSDDID